MFGNMTSSMVGTMTPAMTDAGFGTTSVFIPDIVAHWPMTAGSGSSIASTVNPIANLTGTFSVAPAWDATGGQTGGPCAVFNGTTAYMTWGDIFYYTTFTLFARIYPAVVAGIKCIFLKRNSVGGVTSSQTEFQFIISDGTLSCALFPNTAGTGSQTLATTATIPADAWTSVAVTVGGLNNPFAIYINGASSVSTTQTVTVVDSVSAFQIGARIANNDTRYFAGRMSDAYLYSRALTATEILLIHNRLSLDS